MYRLSKEQKLSNLKEIRDQKAKKLANLRIEIQNLDKKIQSMEITQQTAQLESNPAEAELENKKEFVSRNLHLLSSLDRNKDLDYQYQRLKSIGAE